MARKEFLTKEHADEIERLLSSMELSGRSLAGDYSGHPTYWRDGDVSSIGSCAARIREIVRTAFEKRRF